MALGEKLRGFGRGARTKLTTALGKDSKFRAKLGGAKKWTSDKWTNYKKKRSDKKARAAQQAPAQQAAPSSSSYYPEARGIYGYGYGKPKRESIFAGAGKKGAAIAMIFLLIALLVFFLQLFGIFPRIPFTIFLTFEIILLVLAVLSAVLVGFAGSGSAAAAVFVIILILSFGSGWFTTTLGQQMSGELGIAGVQAGEQARAFGGSINVASQIFRGTYNPENLWRSDQVQSEYVEVKDVGVRILSAAPIRDEFDTSQVPVIQGRIDAVSFPNQDVTVSIGAAEIDPATGGPKGGAPGWNCSHPFTKITEARNRPFTCTADEAIQGVGAHAIEITATAKKTSAIAGKQFVFVNPNIILSLAPGANVLRELGISNDAVQRWQTGDESIDFGVGVAGDYDVLETGDLEYYLGVNVGNPAGSTGLAQITNVELFLPASAPDLQVGNGNTDFSCGKAGATDFGNLNLQAYQNTDLKKCTLTKKIGYLEPGDRQNRFVTIKIDANQLSNQDFSTFFVLARVEFNYENYDTVPLMVKSLAGGGGGGEFVGEPS